MTGVGTIDLGTKQIGFRVEPKLVMTTEGQGRAADPVGFGIPVMIEGPWTEPRIYPEMQGILDNPDAAYAKLREMGKGLFGPNGAGLGGLGGLLGGAQGGTGTVPAADGARPAAPTARPGDLLGGQLGETIGNLLQQGLNGGLGQQAAPARPSRTAEASPAKPRPQPCPGPRAAAQPRPARARAERAGRAAGQPADERRAAAAVQPLTRRRIAAECP